MTCNLLHLLHILEAWRSNGCRRWRDVSACRCLVMDAYRYRATATLVICSVGAPQLGITETGLSRNQGSRPLSPRVGMIVACWNESAASIANGMADRDYKRAERWNTGGNYNGIGFHPSGKTCQTASRLRDILRKCLVGRAYKAQFMRECIASAERLAAFQSVELKYTYGGSPGSA